MLTLTLTLSPTDWRVKITRFAWQNYFDVRQTLEEKVLRASDKGGSGGEEGSSLSRSASSGSFFNFGERSVQSQKAKMLARLNTPHKRFEKKARRVCGSAHTLLWEGRRGRVPVYKCVFFRLPMAAAAPLLFASNECE